MPGFDEEEELAAYDQLEDWQEQVDQWGGRGPVKGAPGLLKQIMASQMSGSTVLPTAGPPVELPRVITLCELRLDQSIPVDVQFTYDNLHAVPGDPRILDPGNGKVQITWGGPKGIAQTAIVDGANGWVHGWSASYLRVDYLPIDELQNGNQNIPFNQPRDLRLSARIVPTAGRQTELQATAFLPDLVGGGGEEAVVIPQYAHDVALMAGLSPFSANIALALVTPGSITMGIWLSDGTPDWPAWQVFMKRTIPQRAVGIVVAMTGPFTDSGSLPTLTFGLRL